MRYEFDAEPAMAFACHCRACQYVSGGSPTLGVIIPKAAFNVTRGEARAWRSTGDSGGVVARHFCPDCGTPLYTELERMPDIVAVKTGGLDDPSHFTVRSWTCGWVRRSRGTEPHPGGRAGGRAIRADRPPMARYDFASDNVAGAMPEVMEALARFNGAAAAGYGDDAVCGQAADLIRALLDADAEVRFTTSGTAANALTLAALAAPHEAVLAHAHSHIATDEAGAPGFFGSGVGIIPLGGASGRIEPAGLDAALARPEDAHWQSPAALTLTHATEYGTLYPRPGLERLTATAKAAGLRLHLDGARLANAVAAGFDPKSLARMGFDVLVIGGAKAGATPTEAVVLFDKTLGRRFGARLKHGGQLVSKARFLSAPWIGMLETGAWSDRAAHANAMAARLAAAMPFEIVHPVEANAVFVAMDEAALTRLREAGWFVYRFIDGSVRFMCSWATTAEAVDEIAEALRGFGVRRLFRVASGRAAGPLSAANQGTFTGE